MKIIVPALIGTAGGLASGLLGVGGGLIFVPLLILMTKMDAHLAIGTSLAAIIPTAIAGMMRHSFAAHVDWKTALIIAVFAVVGAWTGAELSLRLNAILLRRLFSVLLFLMAVKLFFQK